MDKVEEKVITDKKDDLLNFEFSKVIPIISILVWAGAIVDVILYYSYFGIEITYFLEFTEILTLFLSNLIFIISFLFILIGMLFFIKKEKIAISITNTSQKKNWIKRNLVFILLFSLNSISIFLFWYALERTFYLMLFLMLSFIPFYFLIKQINKRYKEKFNEYISNKLLIFILMIFIVCFMIGINITTRIEGHFSMAKNWQSKITLIDGDPIKSDTNSFIIGYTKNYLFVFNISKDENTIIPMSRVKQIDYFRYVPITKKINHYKLVNGKKVFTRTEIKKMHIFGTDTLNGWIIEKPFIRSFRN